MSDLLSVLFGVIAMISFGLNNYLGALMSRKIGAFETSALSRIFALAVLLLIFLLFFFGIPKLSTYIIILLIVTAVVELVGTVAFYKGAKIGQVSIIAPISNSSSVVTIVLGLIFLNSPLQGLDYIGVPLIIIGTVISSFRLKDLKTLKFNKAAAGVGLGLLGMLGWGTGLFTTILLVQQTGWLLPAFLVSVLMVVFYAVYFKTSGINYVAPKAQWFGLVIIGLTLATGLVAYNIGVEGSNPLIVAPIIAAAPALIVILAMVHLKEKIAPSNLFGIVLILVGIVILAL